MILQWLLARDAITIPLKINAFFIYLELPTDIPISELGRFYLPKEYELYKREIVPTHPRIQH